MVLQQAVDLGRQAREVEQVLDADGAPSHLVLVGGADAAPRRSDPAFARRRLAHLVELAMQRQDQRRRLGDAEVVAPDRQALPPEPGDLVGERPRIDDDAVADERQLARPHDAGRK